MLNNRTKGLYVIGIQQLICQCCFAIVRVLLKKVTYLLTYLLLHCTHLEVANETL